MSEKEKKAIEYLENRLDILHCNTQWATENSIKVVLNLIEKQQKEIEKLKTDKKNASEYIREEMYVDENPTLDDDNTITELPISLSLCNEDLRKLLELLED